MKELREDIVKIFDEQRGLLVLLILNFLLGVGLAVMSIVQVANGGTVAKVGYSDLTGYQNGNANEYLSFLILGIVFGIIHDFLGVKIFHKRGAVMATFFMVVTMMLTVGAMITLGRLTN